eukprot:470896-Rhodomonas_salina.7
MANCRIQDPVWTLGTRRRESPGLTRLRLHCLPSPILIFVKRRAYRGGKGRSGTAGMWNVGSFEVALKTRNFRIVGYLSTK